MMTPSDIDVYTTTGGALGLVSIMADDSGARILCAVPNVNLGMQFKFRSDTDTADNVLWWANRHAAAVTNLLSRGRDEALRSRSPRGAR